MSTSSFSSALGPREPGRRRSSSSLALHGVPTISGGTLPVPQLSTKGSSSFDHSSSNGSAGVPLSSAAMAAAIKGMPLQVAASSASPMADAGRQRAAAPAPAIVGQWDIPWLNWLKDPVSTFMAIAATLTAYAVCAMWGDGFSPVRPFLFISHPVEDRPGYFVKGPADVPFLLFYLVLWFHVRQLLAIYVFPHVARQFGLRKQQKIERFTEQAYTLTYATCATIAGVLVMHELPTWWYRTEAYFEHYETHYQMRGSLKTFYLLQSAFWLQQILILAMRMEKPRDDFVELAFHHFVTFYLIFCSYFQNLTLIGNGIFLSMDVSDAFLALAKLINYTDPPEWVSSMAFSVFVGVWTWFRHYENIKILINLFSDVEKIAPEFRVWAPSQGLFMPEGMVWQVFTPIFFLQLVNLFWYYRIWIILIKAIRGIQLADDRETGEDTDDKTH